MNNRLLVLSVLAAVSGVGALGFAYVDPPVNLQASSPGTAQAGNINVTGAILSGNLFASSSGTSDKVVSGWATAQTGFNFGGDFRTASSSGRGVFGSATSSTGFTYGGDFRSASVNGRGVFGWSTATTGQGVGGELRTDSPNGIGAYGWATSSLGTTYGGYFTNASDDGAAVRGTAMKFSGAALGGKFDSLGINGTGVAGNGAYAGGQFSGDKFGILASISSSSLGVSAGEFSASGAGTGGYFYTNGSGKAILASNLNETNTANTIHAIHFGPSGRAFYGVTVSPTGFSYGGLLEAKSVDGRGAYGFASATSGSNYGVYGRTSSAADGYGVYSVGRTAATGTKSFRIDHPLDPEHKYLSHYCSEGPLPLNVYQGTVTTDSKGYAWVALPDYFGEINKDPVYQLTVIDTSADFVLAKVCREIQTNKFQIRSSKGGIKVCWEVKATRNDRFVKVYGAPVETDKPKADQGLFQHPELYGEPTEKGINYRDDVQTALNSIQSTQPKQPR